MAVKDDPMYRMVPLASKVFILVLLISLPFAFVVDAVAPGWVQWAFVIGAFSIGAIGALFASAVEGDRRSKR